MHIDDLLLLKNAQVALGILSSYVIHQPSYFTWTIPPFFFFLQRVLTRKFYKYVETIWVLGHGSLFKAP